MKNYVQKFWLLMSVVAVAFMITNCGGGGGGHSVACDTPTTTPGIIALTVSTTEAGKTVFLNTNTVENVLPGQSFFVDLKAKNIGKSGLDLDASTNASSPVAISDSRLYYGPEDKTKNKAITLSNQTTPLAYCLAAADWVWLQMKVSIAAGTVSGRYGLVVTVNGKTAVININVVNGSCGVTCGPSTGNLKVGSNLATQFSVVGSDGQTRIGTITADNSTATIEIPSGPYTDLACEKKAGESVFVDHTTGTVPVGGSVSAKCTYVTECQAIYTPLICPVGTHYHASDPVNGCSTQGSCVLDTPSGGGSGEGGGNGPAVPPAI